MPKLWHATCSFLLLNETGCRTQAHANCLQSGRDARRKRHVKSSRRHSISGLAEQRYFLRRLREREFLISTMLLLGTTPLMYFRAGRIEVNMKDNVPCYLALGARRAFAEIISAVGVLVCFFAMTLKADGQAPLPDAPSAVIQQAHLAENESEPPACCRGNSNGPKSTTSSLSDLVKNVLKDQEDIYTAPFHKKALKWDIGISAITAALIPIDPEASRKFSGTPKTPNLRISDVGLYSTMGSVGVLYLSGAITDNAHAKETGFLGAEAMANVAITYTILKTATDRERPLVGAGNGRFWHYNRLGSSFPSGHSTLTWAGAAVIAHEYPKRWVQILAYGTATAVAFSRYSGRQHFPSDIFVGSTVGYLIGTHIFNARCAKGNSSSCAAD